MPFEGYTGCYVWQCNLLEHEETSRGAGSELMWLHEGKLHGAGLEAMYRFRHWIKL